MSNIGIECLVVRVGIAEGAVVHTPTKVRTTGLGSCVGLVLYDTTAGVSGLVHVMLPNIAGSASGSLAKYADSAVPWMMEQVCQAGAVASRIRAKMAGGAQMFAFAGKSEIMRVGPRNVEAVKEGLLKLGVPVIAEDVGGNVGRTIEFDGVTETLWIRTAMRGAYVI